MSEAAVSIAHHPAPAAGGNLTIDPAYDAVAPDDFAAMIEVDRYGQRSTAFDKIISATHNHFWDPLDPKYVDFSQTFDLEAEALLPERYIPELRTGVTDGLDEAQKIALINESTRWTLSSILHGEQGALSLSASLCHILKDPGAQEYAANQTREEARHVTGFSRYIQARWGKPTPVSQGLGMLLEELVSTPVVWKKLVGMQMVLEGLAMGIFAQFYRHARDPVLVRLMQLVMSDEAFHHKFGKIWADRTVPKLHPEERDRVEDWALEVFMALLRNTSGPEQKKHMYAAVGIDWRNVTAAMEQAVEDGAIQATMSSSTSVFRTLIRTLLNAGIITARTAPHYSAYVDMEELKREGDIMPGDAIASEGMAYLRRINAPQRREA